MERENNQEIKTQEQQMQEEETITISLEEDSEVEKYRKLAQEMTQAAQSIKAEFDNYRKRNQHQAKISKEEGRAEIVLELLPVLDAFTQAQQFIKDKSVLEGVELIYQKMQDTLAKAGLVKVDSLGAEFNPKYHEAVMMKEEEGKSGMVVQVIQEGYIFGDKVLRPAKVVVGS
jgi:molecular chaperone GrpE